MVAVLGVIGARCCEFPARHIYWLDLSTPGHAQGDALKPDTMIARNVLTTLALAAAYVVLERISSFHEYKGLPFTAWDPGLGLLFAALILRPAVAAPALFMGVTISEAIEFHDALELRRILEIAAIVTCVYTFIAVQVRAFKGFNPALAHVRDVTLLLGAGLTGALLSAFLLLLLFIATGALGWADIAPAGWPHVVGDTIGIAVVSPLALNLAARFQRKDFESPTHGASEAACFLGVLAIFAWLMTGARTQENLQYFYLLFIPVIIAAVRHGLTGASLALAATQAALVFVLDWLDTDASHFTAYQTLMLALTATGLFVGAIVSERDAARRLVQGMEREAARAARFNLLSSMTATLSHEINQPLTAARARARIIEKLIETGGLARVHEHVAPLVAQIDRAANILQRMREFLRRGESERKPVAWADIAGGAQTLLSPLAREEQIRMEWTSDEPLPPVMCDRIQIEQVLVNLAVNAIEALTSMDAGDRTLRIAARESLAGAAIEFSVSDNGPGIDPSIAGKLFDAMATTRAEGLGLGLAICVSIVEAHNGKLWLETTRPGLTEFRFRIPLSAETSKA